VTENKEIAAIFREIGDLLELTDANPFQVRAYRRGAQTIDALRRDTSEMTAKDISALDGIGPALRDKIIEYGETGAIKALKQIRTELPAGVPKMLGIPGLGPKKIRAFWKELGIDSVGKLKHAAATHALQELPGIKDRTEENILAGIAAMGSHSKNTRWPYSDAKKIADRILRKLKKVAGTEQIAIAGSLRRKAPTIGDIDILATAADSTALMTAFVDLPIVAKVSAHGATKSSIATTDGMQVDLRVVPAESFGAALQYFTGSQSFNIATRKLAIKKGMKLNEYGLFDAQTGEQLAGETEKEVFKELGLKYVPPEKRHDASEVL